MTDDVREFVPWTKAGAERLLAAAADLTEAITAHAQALAIMTAADDDGVFDASELLVPAVVAYAEAQGGLTGYAFPFGVIAQYVEGDDGPEDDEDASGLNDRGHLALSVVQRRDYLVKDVEAVMTAGRRAYLRTWPEGGDAAAAADVDHLGRALYQLAHADGWDSLYRADGLEPVGGVVAVIEADELLSPDPDDWVEDLIGDEVEVIYSQADIYKAR